MSLLFNTQIHNTYINIICYYNFKTVQVIFLGKSNYIVNILKIE